MQPLEFAGATAQLRRQNVADENGVCPILFSFCRRGSPAHVCSAVRHDSLKHLWVLRQASEPAVGAHGEVQPAHVPDNLAGQLRGPWTAPASDDINCEDFSWAEGVEHWINCNHEPLNLTEFTGEEIYSALRKSAGMAPGPDGWRACRCSPCGRWRGCGTPSFA